MAEWELLGTIRLTIFKVYTFVYLRERTAGPASFFVRAARCPIRTTEIGVACNIPRLCALPGDCGYLLNQRHGAGFVVAGHGGQIAFLTVRAAVNEILATNSLRMTKRNHECIGDTYNIKVRTVKKTWQTRSYLWKRTTRPVTLCCLTACGVIWTGCCIITQDIALKKKKKVFRI